MEKKLLSIDRLHYGSLAFQEFLVRNLFKNVSKGAAFLWQTQIQTIEYDLNDTIRMKRMDLYW